MRFSKSRRLILFIVMIVTLMMSGCGKEEISDEIADKDTYIEPAVDVSEPAVVDEETEPESEADNETHAIPETEIQDEGLTAEGPYVGPRGLEIEQIYKNSTYTFRMPDDDLNFKIYYTKEEKESVVYSSEKDTSLESLENYRFLSQMYVKDENQDGTEEVYLFFEDRVLETPMVIVLDYPDFELNIQKGLHMTYWGYGDDLFIYEDINGDGRCELISPYPGGGGVTTWEGFDLVNVYNPSTMLYEFSYPLTRQRYEEAKAGWEYVLQSYLSPENWEGLLNSYADLGDVEACVELIEKGKSLEELNLYPDWDGPYDTYFEYVINRAQYYKDIWDELRPEGYEEETVQGVISNDIALVG